MPLRKPVDQFDDPLSMIQMAIGRDGGDDVPRVGKYKADYSELTPEQIAADAGCDDLFEHSKEKPVSR